jgi:hypothetical protein
MASGLLVYLLAAFRLMSVQKNILPLDPRKRVRASTRRQETRTDRLPEVKPQPRPEKLVQPSESLTILGSAGGVTLLAFAFGRWLQARNAYDDLDALSSGFENFEVSDAAWQFGVLLWSVGLLLIALSGVLAYVGMTRRGPLEARLYLQDVLWKETRREQSRIARWMAWAALDTRKHQSVPPIAATPAPPGRPTP